MTEKSKQTYYHRPALITDRMDSVTILVFDKNGHKIDEIRVSSEEAKANGMTTKQQLLAEIESVMKDEETPF